MTQLLLAVTCIVLTVITYHSMARLQAKLKLVWLNPMLFTIFVAIFILSFFDIDYQTYKKSTKGLHSLLEPAIVALGFPLYQHLDAIKKHWKVISLSLTFGALTVISISFLLTWIFTNNYEISVSLALKSITTPIGLSLTEQLAGNQAITAFAIIIAGLTGAIIGVKWLSLLKVNSTKAQGLAIGAASHALGTATISHLSYEHAAYSSIALIYSAVITAVIAPVTIKLISCAII